MGDACCGNESANNAGDSEPPNRHPELPGQERPLLTPDDVHHKWFTTVRLREGYDLREVDDFLHEVEYTLDRLYKENGTLREQPRPALPVPVREIASHDSESAARIIALADQTANQTIASARSEAHEIVSSAQEQAELVRREARTDVETLENSKLALIRQLAELRGLVAEYRSRLQHNLDSQLDDVERRTEDYLASLPTRPMTPEWQARPASVPQQPAHPSINNHPQPSAHDDRLAG